MACNSCWRPPSLALFLLLFVEMTFIFNFGVGRSITPLAATDKHYTFGYKEPCGDGDRCRKPDFVCDPVSKTCECRHSFNSKRQMHMFYNKVTDRCESAVGRVCTLPDDGDLWVIPCVPYSTCVPNRGSSILGHCVCNDGFEETKSHLCAAIAPPTPKTTTTTTGPVMKQVVKDVDSSEFKPKAEAQIQFSSEDDVEVIEELPSSTGKLESLPLSPSPSASPPEKSSQGQSQRFDLNAAIDVKSVDDKWVDVKGDKHKDFSDVYQYQTRNSGGRVYPGWWGSILLPVCLSFFLLL